MAGFPSPSRHGKGGAAGRGRGGGSASGHGVGGELHHEVGVKALLPVAEGAVQLGLGQVQEGLQEGGVGAGGATALPAPRVQGGGGQSPRCGAQRSK